MRSNIVSLRINVALGLSFTPCLLRTITARTIIGTVILKNDGNKKPRGFLPEVSNIVRFL
jgi:hypothetical protein